MTTTVSMLSCSTSTHMIMAGAANATQTHRLQMMYHSLTKTRSSGTTRGILL